MDNPIDQAVSYLLEGLGEWWFDEASTDWQNIYPVGGPPQVFAGLIRVQLRHPSGATAWGYGHSIGQAFDAAAIAVTKVKEDTGGHEPE